MPGEAPPAAQVLLITLEQSLQLEGPGQRRPVDLHLAIPWPPPTTALPEPVSPAPAPPPRSSAAPPASSAQQLPASAPPMESTSPPQSQLPEVGVWLAALPALEYSGQLVRCSRVPLAEVSDQARPGDIRRPAWQVVVHARLDAVSGVFAGALVEVDLQIEEGADTWRGDFVCDVKPIAAEARGPGSGPAHSAAPAASAAAGMAPRWRVKPGTLRSQRQLAQPGVTYNSYNLSPIEAVGRLVSVAPLDSPVPAGPHSVAWQAGSTAVATGATGPTGVSHRTDSSNHTTDSSSNTTDALSLDVALQSLATLGARPRIGADGRGPIVTAADMLALARLCQQDAANRPAHQARLLRWVDAVPPANQVPPAHQSPMAGTAADDEDDRAAAEALTIRLAGLEWAGDHELLAWRAAALASLLTLDADPKLHDWLRDRRRDRLRRGLVRSVTLAVGPLGARSGQRGWPLAAACLLPLTDVPAVKAALSRAAEWDALASEGPHAQVRQRDGVSASGRFDPTMGELRWVARCGEQSHQPLWVLDSALGWATDAAATRRGHFELRRQGRCVLGSEIARPTTEALFAWMPPEALNVLRVDASRTTRRGPLRPIGRATLKQLRLGTSGSIGISNAAFAPVLDVDNDDPIEDAYAWRTLGADFQPSSANSRHAGTMSLAILDGCTLIGDREQVWQLHLGDIPADQVTIDGPKFTIRRPAEGVRIDGQFLLPATMYLTYLPPGKQADGSHRPSGTLEARRDKPGGDSLTVMIADIDARLSRQIDPRLAAEQEFSPEQIQLELAGPDATQTQRVRYQTETLYLKLLAETSSVKMGAPDRKPRAASQILVVLTVCDLADTPPPITVADHREPHLATIGPRRLLYREHEFYWE